VWCSDTVVRDVTAYVGTESVSWARVSFMIKGFKDGNKTVSQSYGYAPHFGSQMVIILTSLISLASLWAVFITNSFFSFYATCWALIEQRFLLQGV
jgi:hypothetical protein